MVINEIQRLQSQASLIRSASLANKTVDKTERVPDAKTNTSPRGTASPVHDGVRIAFFFDGTGNNLDADVGNGEHSNVARLFRAHLDNDPSLGIFRFYIPGIGTRFKDIGDPGGEDMGLAFAARGEDRLDWAMRKLEERLVQSKGRKIHLALFGFSRGAALARAFARLVADRCERGTDGLWHLTHKKTRYQVRLYFMGLFDTVASVGSPMGTNNLQSIDLTSGLLDLRQALQGRHAYGSTLDDIAFASGGAPGADPASGLSNGHMGWADDLRIPDMVDDCLHMIAAHEIRNSFPVDSLLQNLRYPRNCRERVYPGAHSDVGGGYRRGEGARSPSPGSFLSLVPLRHMRAEAISADLGKGKSQHGRRRENGAERGRGPETDRQEARPGTGVGDRVGTTDVRRPEEARGGSGGSAPHEEGDPGHAAGFRGCFRSQREPLRRPTRGGRAQAPGLREEEGPGQPATALQGAARGV
jgi:hypothetical protein